MSRTTSTVALDQVAAHLGERVSCAHCGRDNAISHTPGEATATCHRCRANSDRYVTDAVDLWVRVRGVPHDAARDQLAEAGFEVDTAEQLDPEDQARKKHAKRIWDTYATQVRDQLDHHPRALRYVESRGIDLASLPDEVIIGYEPGTPRRGDDHEAAERIANAGTHRYGHDKEGNAYLWPVLARRIVIGCRQGGHVVGMTGRLLDESVGVDHELTEEVLAEIQQEPTDTTDVEPGSEPPKYLLIQPPEPDHPLRPASVWWYRGREGCDGPTWIVEGVVDWVLLCQRGAAALCTLSAATDGGAVVEHARLRHAEVALAPDRDRPSGRSHVGVGDRWAARLAAALTRAKVRCTIARLPDGAHDLADLLAAPRAEDALAGLVAGSLAPWDYLLDLVPDGTPEHEIPGWWRDLGIIQLLACDEDVAPVVLADAPKKVRKLLERDVKAARRTPVPAGVAPLTDMGNAERFADRYRAAVTLLREFADENPDVDAILDWCEVSESRRHIGDMLALALAQPGMSCSKGDMDRDPYLLCTKNGVVDLRDGRLLRHDARYMMTRSAAAEYVPDATHAEWERLLAWAMSEDADMVAYLQRHLGYACTGVVLEELLHVWIGFGLNSKSTVMGAITRVLGSYALLCAPGLLTSKGEEGHPTAIVDLRGIRLAVVGETDEGESLLAARLKQLTDRYYVAGHKMHQDWERFSPTHHLVLFSNHAPRVRSADEGTWRRIRRVPWTRTLAEHEIDRDLPARLDTVDARQAILAWLVRGAIQYLRDGLGTPPARVSAATSSYRQNSDVLGRFLRAECDVGPDHRVGATELYDAYKDWARREGHMPWTQHRFGRLLLQRGIVKEGTKPVVRLGVRLRVDADDDVDDIIQLVPDFEDEEASG